MKKIILIGVIVLTVLGANAQSYKTGIGLAIDFGDGSTLVGPQVKHFFSANNAINAQVVFGDNISHIAGYYQYHGALGSERNLQWYLGLGPAVSLYKGGSDFFIRPTAGLDYKISNAPIALSFDWRPAIRLTHDADFEPARFGFGFNYTLN